MAAPRALQVLVQGILQALGVRRMLVDLYNEAIKNRTYAAEDETLRSTMHRASLLLMQYVRPAPAPHSNPFMYYAVRMFSSVSDDIHDHLACALL